MGCKSDDRVGDGVCIWLTAPILIALAVLGANAQPAPPSPGSGRIVSLTGGLSIRSGAMPARMAQLQGLVQAGDELVTGANAEAVIQTSDGSTVRIFPDSRVIFSEPAAGAQDFLHLFLGSIKVHIEKLSGRPNPHRMTTPTAVIAVRGTTFSVFVDETDATLVAVDEGIVGVSSVNLPAREVLVRRGQRTWVRPGQAPTLAARFRGPSERADMVAGGGNGGMQGGAMGGMGMGQGAGNGPRGMGGMGGRGGPPR